MVLLLSANILKICNNKVDELRQKISQEKKKIKLEINLPGWSQSKVDLFVILYIQDTTSITNVSIEILCCKSYYASLMRSRCQKVEIT